VQNELGGNPLLSEVYQHLDAALDALAVAQEVTRRTQN
jgi:hypothetical protein